jgi:hypothetical protein
VFIIVSDSFVQLGVLKLDVFSGDLLLLGEENQSRCDDVQIWEWRLVRGTIKISL